MIGDQLAERYHFFINHWSKGRASGQVNYKTKELELYAIFTFEHNHDVKLGLSTMNSKVQRVTFIL